MSIDTPDLQALIDLSEKATAGPWRECGHDRGGCSCGRIWSLGEDLPIAGASMSHDEETRQARTGSEQRKYNAEFIAALVNWFRTQAPTLAAGEGFSASDMMDARRDERERIALHAAEAELGELRRRVVAKADDWDARNRLDQSDAQWMREKTYEQCADELRQLLASDGGAD